MNHTCALSDLRPGQMAVIHDLSGGYSFRSRLAALGFTPGVQVRVVQNLGHGPMIVNVRDTRIALGRGEAQKVVVRPEGRG